jgi:hypothetical protein
LAANDKPKDGCAEALKGSFTKNLGVLGVSLMVTSAVLAVGFLAHWWLWAARAEPPENVQADLRVDEDAIRSEKRNKTTKKGDAKGDPDDVWTRD